MLFRCAGTEALARNRADIVRWSLSTEEQLMPTSEEIEQRVREVDSSRTARRATASQQVSDLAEQRAEVAVQLEQLERRLGDVLADAQDVITIDELAGFIDVKATDLTRWLAGRSSARAKRRKPAVSTTPERAKPGSAATTPSPASQENLTTSTQ
jgi:hypothetical protein